MQLNDTRAFACKTRLIGKNRLKWQDSMWCDGDFFFNFHQNLLFFVSYYYISYSDVQNILLLKAASFLFCRISMAQTIDLCNVFHSFSLVSLYSITAFF